MIRLAIIEDNTSFRTTLENVIRRETDIKIVYSDHGIKNLISNSGLQPNVVVMDISITHDSNGKSIERVLEVYPKANILMLTIIEDEEKIFESIKAGAHGYLLRKDCPEKIVEAVFNIHNGESVINGHIARRLLDYFVLHEKHSPTFQDYHLTKREQEILMLLNEGLSYKQIAARCFISIDTLNTHIRKVYGKLNVHSRSEIAAKFRK
jgi:DNA-binding NarL/FixJ family response regulator